MHRSNVLRTGVGFLVSFGIMGCVSTTRVGSHGRIGDSHVMLTTADVRSTMSNRRPDGEEGATVLCAEPSPDLARAVSTTFSVGLSIPEGVTPEVAAAVTAARAESMAQLGERLAAIQLLRDALYRSCVARTIPCLMTA